MKGNNITEISIKHLKRKENILFLIILTLLMTILFILATAINFALGFVNNTNNHNILARTLVVDTYNKENSVIEKINNIKHIAINISDIYRNPVYSDAPEFTTDNLRGSIAVWALLTDDFVKVIDGRNIANEREILIPTKFYPHSEFTDDGKEKIVTKAILNGKSLIGKTITVKSTKGYPTITSDMSIDEYDALYEEWNKHREYITFTIVGTYDANSYQLEKNTCFISKDAFLNIKDANDVLIEAVNSDGDTVLKNDFTNRLIIVDQYKNLDYVKGELTKLGFNFTNILEYDFKELLIITILPIIIAIIIIFTVIKITKSFILKKFNNIKSELGLLKTFGYSNKDIINIYLIENILITIISLIIALILFIISFIFALNYVDILTKINYFSVSVNIPYFYLFIIFIFITIYIYHLNKKTASFYLSKEIASLLKED